MSVESQALYNQTNLLSWKTSYPLYNVKDVPEPPIQTYSYFSNLFPSDKILKRYTHNKSNRYVWQVSVSPDGSYILILKNNNIEFRSSKQDCSQIIFQCQIYKDFYPQWRAISWSQSSSYFAVSFTNGMVNIWDLQGTKLSLNTGCVKSNDFDVIIKILINELSKTKLIVSVFTLSGRLFVYHINNAKVVRQFPSQLKCISTPVLCCESSGNILVLGTYNQTNCSPDSEAFKSGIVLCRIIDEEPFLLSTNSHKESGVVAKSWFSFFTTKKPSDAVFSIRISTDNGKLAALHYSGQLSLWNFPSMIVCFTWRSSAIFTNPSLSADSLRQKVFPSHFTDSGIVDICWWHSEYVAVALRNGRIVILGLDQSAHSKVTESILLCPFPQLTEASGKSFFALNCVSKSSKTERKTTEIVARNSRWNVLSLLMSFLLPDSQTVTLSDTVCLCAQSYTLIGHELTTPEELFTIRIDKKQYAEALLLCIKYGLDSDLVFKKQWRDSAKTILDISKILIKIKKPAWILNECLEQIPLDLAAMKLLLKLGLYLTDIGQLESGAFEDGELAEETLATIDTRLRNTLVEPDKIAKLAVTEFTLVQIELIRIRMKLLSHWDKLTVYETILAESHTNYNDQLFSELKKLSVFEIVIKFARNNNMVGLGVVLQFYKPSLGRHLLTILSNIPESIKPLSYRDLLQDNLTNHNGVLEPVFTDRDWCESENFCQIYNGQSTLNETENRYYQHNPAHASFILTINNDNAPIIRDWCHRRILTIEQETFNASHALEMLQIFRDLNIEMDENLEFNLRFLYEGVYNCQVANAFISLTEFQSLTDLDKANMLMSKTSPERFLMNFNHWIMPMFEDISRQSVDRSLAFIRDYLLNLGKKYLLCARKLLEDKDSLGKLIAVVNYKEIVTIYLTILCEDDDWLNINECATISRLLRAQTPSEYIAELKQLQEVDNYIAVLRILDKYELKKTIKFVHNNKMNGELVENLITNMVFHYFKTAKNVNKAMIKSVFTEIQTSLSLVFKSVHPTLIYKNLLKSLLESGDKKKINLASEFMMLSTKLTPLDDLEFHEKLIDFTDAVQCILVAARNYINMSTSSKDSNMLLAKYCLDLVVNQTEETIAETEIIKCCEFLDKWHCSLVPIELRAMDNRFDLLTHCLDKNKYLYQEMEEVIDAGTYFYANKCGDKKFKEGEALRLIAQKAFNNNDQYNLEIAMSSLIHRNHKPCWAECVMTLKVVDYPVKKKFLLGKYAVTHCPDSVLTETVRMVNEVEMATLNLSESQSKDSVSSSTNTNTNSNLISQPMKYLSLGFNDLSTKIKLKDTISKLTTQVTKIGFGGTHETLYNNDKKQLTAMSLDLIYAKNGPLNLDSDDKLSTSDIVRILTLPLATMENDKRLKELDQMHLRLVQFNLNRDTYLTLIHAMFITDLSLIYNLRADLIVNTFTRALIYAMVTLNLILKYCRPFPVLNQISADNIATIVEPLKTKMSDNELSILKSTEQEFQDYSLLDDIIVTLPSLSTDKFFSSVDYRKKIVFQLSEFSDNEKQFAFALLLADRYNVDRYELSWHYFTSFVATVDTDNNTFEDNYSRFKRVFNLQSFLNDFRPLLTKDLEKRLSTIGIERIREWRTILKLLPTPCNDLILFNKTVDQHRTLMDMFDVVFCGALNCDYLDLCMANKIAIVSSLKLVVNSENVDMCSQLMDEFDLSLEFARIKNDFSSVLANQMLWCQTDVNNDSELFLSRFNKSLANFSVNDCENCKEFIASTLFEQNNVYICPDIKISVLKCTSKFIDRISDSCNDEIANKWPSVSLEVSIWLDHLESTVVKVADKLRQLSSMTEKIVLSAEYMPPDNYWQCLLTEMLLQGVSYQDLFTFTWDLSVDSFTIDDSIVAHICHISSSKYLPPDAIVEKLSQIMVDLDDYMDCENIHGILERVLEQAIDSKEQVHRMLLDEFVFRIRKNKCKTVLPIDQHIIRILKSWVLPINEKITFQKSNIHLVDAFMQDCENSEKMKVIPKIIELIELVEEDNNLWQCWIKTCVIKGTGYCSFIYEQFENLKSNKLYAGRIDKLAKDAVQSLTAFNSAEAISILILMDPMSAVEKVQLILLALKSDPTEYTNTMKNINTRALQIIVDGKLIPIYAQTILYQRLVNFLTREMNDSNIVQEVLEQLKEKGLVNEATWLTSSSSHINPAMKTLEMFSGFWNRFSSGGNT